MLLTKKFTKYSYFTEAFQGEGIDYWIGFPTTSPEYDPFNFLKARLEVSGIKKENASNNVALRLRQKSKQAGASDGTATEAYISIIEFNTPKALFKKK